MKKLIEYCATNERTNQQTKLLNICNSRHNFQYFVALLGLLMFTFVL